MPSHSSTLGTTTRPTSTSSAVRYLDRATGTTSTTPGTTPGSVSSSGSTLGVPASGISYSEGPSRSYVNSATGSTGTSGGLSGTDPGASSVGTTSGATPGVIDLSGATPARHIPLPRFADSNALGRSDSLVRPSAGHTARSGTRPSPSSAATLPGRPVTGDDIISRYRGDPSAGRSNGTRSSTGSELPLLSARRRAPAFDSTRSSGLASERGATGTPSGTSTGAEPSPAQLRERAASAAQQRKRRMNQLAKKDPGRAKGIGAGGLVLGKAIESGLDIGTRIVTGGAIGAADILSPRGRPGGVDGTGGGSGGGSGAGGGPGRPGDLGGGTGGAGNPRGGGRGGGDTPPGGDVGTDDSYGGHYGGGYYGGGLYDPSYNCWNTGLYYGSCYYPYYGYCYPWIGWGWRSCWNWYWYDLGYCWGPWYPRYGGWYSVPIYQVTTQVVYETVVQEEEEPVYIETHGADVNAFTSEPQEPDSLSAQQALARASEYYLTLGDRSFREGKYGDAVHFYAKAVEFGERQGVLYLVLADALFATGDYHYAAFAVRKALELDPNLVDGVIDKRNFYSDPTEFDRQLALLERYVEDHFLDQDARLVLIVNYLFANRPEAALALLQDDFSKGIAASPVGQLLTVRLGG